MIISLDTTYFLYGFSIKPDSDIPQNCLDIILQQPKLSKIIFSDFVIFELNAKASKLSNECLDLDTMTEKLVELDESEKFKIIKSFNQKIWSLACLLRKYHTDFIDCIHLATSIANKCEVFLSEDKKIKKMSKNNEILNLLQSNSDFKMPEVMNFKNLTK